MYEMIVYRDIGITRQIIMLTVHFYVLIVLQGILILKGVHLHILQNSNSIFSHFILSPDIKLAKIAMLFFSPILIKIQKKMSYVFIRRFRKIKFRSYTDRYLQGKLNL